MFLDTLRLAFRALMRNRSRTFLTMLGIIIGISSVIIMISVGTSLTNYMSGAFQSFGTKTITVRHDINWDGGYPTCRHYIDNTDYEAIRSGCTHLTAVSPNTSAVAPVICGNHSYDSPEITGVSPDFLLINNIQIARGIMFSDADIQSRAKVCVIGTTITSELFPDGESPVGKTVRLGNVPMTVIGEIKELRTMFDFDRNTVILVPYTTIQTRFTGDNRITISATYGNETNGQIALEEIRRVLRNHHGLKADEEDDFNLSLNEEDFNTLNQILNIVTLVLTFIAGIALLVGGVGIMNIMYVTVSERIREIGLRKALGARRRNIMMQFLVESVVLSLVGGIIGVLLGEGIYALALAIVSALLEEIPFVFNPMAIIISLSVCTAVGLFFGWYPARKAANLDPIQALRYE